MDKIKPLPAALVDRYRTWKATDYAENEAAIQKLADEGQHPSAMIVTCCDSRVQASSLFGAKPGDYFIHRNIANLVPPFTAVGDHHATSAAIEYGVTVLKVQNLIVMGHSKCGGAAGCSWRDHAPAGASSSRGASRSTRL